MDQGLKRLGGVKWNTDGARPNGLVKTLPLPKMTLKGFHAGHPLTPLLAGVWPRAKGIIIENSAPGPDL